jgi:hypothetical protein
MIPASHGPEHIQYQQWLWTSRCSYFFRYHEDGSKKLNACLFFYICFMQTSGSFIMIFSSVAPHRGQPAAKCHLRWQPTRWLAVSCGLGRCRIRTRAGTAGQQSGALPLSHHASQNWATMPPKLSHHASQLNALACYSYTWFIFNLNTKSYYLQIIYYSIHTSDNTHKFNPLLPITLLSYLLGEPDFLDEYPSTLVPGLPTTAHPLLVHPPFHTSQIKLQYIHRRHQQHQPSSSDTLFIVKLIS